MPTTVSDAAATLGRRGGQARTAAQTEARRINGRKGGRPRLGRLVWQRDHEWTSARIYASPTGYRVESEAAIAGARSGRAVLIPYCSDAPREWVDSLDSPINDAGTTRAEYLLHLADTGAGRTLRAGYIVR